MNKDFIIEQLQSILNKEHAISAKTKIKVHPDRLNFSCPLCGDSEKDHHKKRGNIYLNSMMYVCYNCDTRISYLKFLQNFNINLDVEQKLQLYEYIDNNIKFKKESDDFTLSQLDKLIPLNEIIEHSKKDGIQGLKFLRPVKFDSQAYIYLLNRKIKNHENIYEGLFYHSPKWIEPVIVILNKCQDKVVGLQIRNLQSDKKKRFFKIYDFEDIFYALYPEKELDDVEIIAYNKLSHFYNLLNVNLDKTITIFEGYLDSIFYPNSIAMIGVNSANDIKFLQDSEGVEIRFFFDNDQTGIDAALENIKQGYKVFLWYKLFDDIIAKKEDKIAAIDYLKNIKDLNDLSKKVNTPYEHFKLENYFSIDIYDKRYLNINYYY